MYRYIFKKIKYIHSFCSINISSLFPIFPPKQKWILLMHRSCGVSLTVHLRNYRCFHEFRGWKNCWNTWFDWNFLHASSFHVNWKNERHIAKIDSLREREKKKEKFTFFHPEQLQCTGKINAWHAEEKKIFLTFLRCNLNCL